MKVVFDIAYVGTCASINPWRVSVLYTGHQEQDTKQNNKQRKRVQPLKG